MMSGFRFESPWLLALLALLPLLAWLWSRRSWRPVIRFSGLDELRAARRAHSERARLILPVLRLAALACLIVAAARPQQSDRSIQTFVEGIAIQMVVDTSPSMEDNDLSPRGSSVSRLGVVKEVFKRFVIGDSELGLAGRPNDLIGMVRFARYADSICPLTLDHAALLKVLDATNVVALREEMGTAYGEGLALAVERLRDVQRVGEQNGQVRVQSRIAILLTDGEENISRAPGSNAITPEQAGELAAKYGIKVYTILAATGEQTPLGRRPLDDRELRQIADVTRGKFFHARDVRGLLEIYRSIDELERTRVQELSYVAWDELARPWLIAALGCLAGQMLLGATRMRKIP